MIDKGVYIQSLRSILDSKMLDSTGLKEKIKYTVDKCATALESMGSSSEQDKIDKIRIRTLNLLTKVYYNYSFDGYKLANSLVTADDKLTMKMKNLIINYKMI